MKPIAIVEALLVGEYRLRLTFDDAKVQEVDFLPFLSASHHPAIRAYLERERFANFHLECGDLLWGDYELCFPIADLYENRLLHSNLQLAA